MNTDRELYWELRGVIADVEEGNGFDDVCLETIKRVANHLATPYPEALRAALAQPEPEPVAWMHPEWNTYTRAPAMSITPKEDWTPLYTAPPQREELRRLHEVNAELVEALKEMVEWYAARDANDQIRPALNQNPEIHEAMQVLAKATGEQQ